jgi:hypothetical protein
MSFLNTTADFLFILDGQFASHKEGVRKVTVHFAKFLIIQYIQTT